MQHRITIRPSGGEYRVSGAVIVEATGTPMPDAARALIAAGASPSDELSVASQDATFVPMALGKLAAIMRRNPKSKTVTTRITNPSQEINAPLIESNGWIVESFRASNLPRSAHPAFADSNTTPAPVNIADITTPPQVFVPTR